MAEPGATFGDRTPPTVAPLSPPERSLFGPGPTPVHPQVVRAMAAPSLGHLDPDFQRIMGEVSDLLRYVFGTANRVTFPVPATGSGGMEAALVNAIAPGDPVVIGVNGYFGVRMVQMAERFGGVVTRVDAPWGEVIPAERYLEAAQRSGARVATIVHAETSTGALHPLAEIARGLRELPDPPLFVVDCVTSLGAHPVEVDEVGIDIAYSGSQKALSAPSGLAPITFGPRAVERIASRPSAVGSWYLDEALLASYWGDQRPRAYHHTASAPLVYALHEALRIVAEEGLPARAERHARNHEAFRRGIEALGTELHAQEGHRLWTLNTVRVPPGTEVGSVQKRLLDRYGIEVGAGIGDLVGKVWRVGLMGYGSQRRNVALLLAAFGQLLHEDGVVADAGAGVAASAEAYAELGREAAMAAD
jgi:alanine-glyoxylate transaminase/serine-glyoxylate transaminase/serine-pyruvate transaminase